MLDVVQDLLRFIEQENGEVTPKEPPQLQSKVAIVLGVETLPQRELLERMGQALQKEGISTRIAAPGELPEPHVIVTRKTLGAHPLPRTRMFVIEDVDLYLREPAQRRNLWKEILAHVR